ncbi:MAG: gluconolactonase [Bradyrhizobium sp.]|nr:gluconolactonase [Bradyrhizobium sp.]
MPGNRPTRRGVIGGLASLPLLAAPVASLAASAEPAAAGDIPAHVFARLPAGLRKTATPNALSRIVSGRDFGAFLEGPCFDAGGLLHCVDSAYGRVFRIDASGTMSLFIAYDGAPNGAKFHRDGRLFLADRDRGILAVDPATRVVTPIIAKVDLEPFRGVNDLVFARGGDLYFTDQGMSDIADPTGRVYRLRANGQLDLLLDHLPGPNGIALDSAERTLFVALTRANQVLRAALMPDGRLSRVATFLQLSGGGGPDGIAVAADGGLVVARPLLGGVWLFDPQGVPRGVVRLSEGALGTNIAFDGAGNRRLFITEVETGTIQVADLPFPGTPLL